MADRLQLAERFLQEAVYESRARQAAGASLRPGRAGEAGNCGLGAQAAVVLDLSEQGRALYRELWPADPAAEARARIRAATAEWIELQDRLDRKRNHFLKEFRQRHGFDRAAYAPEQIRAFDEGLERINAEVEAERRRAAERLL